MAWFDQYVGHVPGVQGGAAIIRGTRTPVSSVLAKYQTYEGGIKAILEAQPHLSEIQVRAALAYAEAHADEIAADEERHRRARERFLVVTP